MNAFSARYRGELLGHNGDGTKRDGEKLSERRGRTVVGGRGEEAGSSDCSIADQACGCEAFDLAMQGALRDAEPLRELADRILGAWVQVQPGKDLGLILGPEDRQ